MAKQKSFNQAKRWLKKKFPTHYPVRIYCVNQSTIQSEYKRSGDYIKEECEYDGLCLCYERNKKKTFKILIDKSLDNDGRIHCLFHEYSHALRDHLPEDVIYSQHDDVWKTYHSRILRNWHGEID